MKNKLLLLALLASSNIFASQETKRHLVRSEQYAMPEGMHAHQCIYGETCPKYGFPSSSPKGALRTLAIATGMVTPSGLLPSFAQADSLYAGQSSSLISSPSNSMGDEAKSEL